MRCFLVIVPFTLLLFAGGCMCYGWVDSGTIDVKDVRQGPEATPDLTSHKYHDVEVYRTKHNAQIDSVNIVTADAYGIFFYGNDNNTLRCYQAYDDVAEDFDKAEYHWEDDTLLSIRLYNSRTKKGITKQVFGNGNTTGTNIE